MLAYNVQLLWCTILGLLHSQQWCKCLDLTSHHPSQNTCTSSKLYDYNSTVHAMHIVNGCVQQLQFQLSKRSNKSKHVTGITIGLTCWNHCSLECGEREEKTVLISFNHHAVLLITYISQRVLANYIFCWKMKVNSTFFVR